MIKRLKTSNRTILALIATLLLSHCSSPMKKLNQRIKILHYNIFELESSKIKEDHPQIIAVKKVLEDLEFDLISINEIQYDLPRVPNPTYETTGENLNHLMKILRPQLNWSTSFFPANTGSLAKQKNNFEYVNSKDPQARSYADPYNYGLFPAQYSVGLASQLPILSKKVISKLAWKEFNPNLDLSIFKAANGSKLPDNLELFDKNFVDTIVKIQNREVHVITLHTVPAYHFGNQQTPNYMRNSDQLAFLEWYVDSASPLRKSQLNNALVSLGIVPLKKGQHFIVMGDLNTEINAKNPGSKVLKRLYKSLGIRIPSQKTHESPGFSTNPFMMQLDYILYSSTFLPHQESVILDKPKALGNHCTTKNNSPNKTLVHLKGTTNCNINIPSKYAWQKKASDHFALYTELYFKD